MEFSVFGPFRGVTGYDSVVRNFLKEWHEHSHIIQTVEFERWSNLRGPTDMDSVLELMDKTPLHNPKFHLNFCLLDQANLNPNTSNYVYTMFEANSIPKIWVDSIKRLEAVIVPTQWNKDCFVKSGVPENKVLVCPVPLDIKKITKQRSFSMKTFDGVDIMKYKHRFLNVSEFITRKNIDGLLQAWIDTIKPEDDACLILKLCSNSGLKTDFIKQKLDRLSCNKKCAPVYIYTDFLTEEQMLGLYSICTHYVTASYGEGWGMSESVCGVLGKKLIAPASTAFIDYLNKDNSYPVMVQGIGAHQEGPTARYYQGSVWYAPIQFSLRKQLKASIADANNNDFSKEQLLSKQLKEKCDSDFVANKLVNMLASFEPKKTKLTVKQDKLNWMLICKSAGQKCGIGDYSTYLYKATQEDSVKSLFDSNMFVAGDSTNYSHIIEDNNLHLINLQLEYQFISPSRLDLFLRFLKNSNIIATVTLHTVNPQAVDYHRILIQHNCKIIVSSEIMKSVLLTCGFKDSNIKVIPMGITKDGINNSSLKFTKKYRIGFFGFTYFHKGVDKIINYMNKFGDNKECVLLSTKPENDHGYAVDLFKSFEQKQLTNTRWISEFLKEEEAVNILSSCDTIFLPYSEYGGYGVSAAIRTCLKAGVPIITFDNPFFNDVVREYNLIKVLKSNPDDFYSWSNEFTQVCNEINNKEYKEQFIANRNKFINDWCWESVAKEYVKYFNQLYNS